MYNLGVKDQKVKNKTIETYQELQNLNNREDCLVQNVLNQKRSRKNKLTLPSTEFNIHRDMLERKALYGDIDIDKIKYENPEFFGH